MKYDKFFALAKAAGIEDAELYISQSENLSFSLFHGEVDNYSANNGLSIHARGLVNGKLGSAACDSWNNAKAQYLVNEILGNAKVIENDDPVFIFEGSPKYKKVNTYNKDLKNVPVEEKLAKLHYLESKIKEVDTRIYEIEGVEYSESSSTTMIFNSKGLKLQQKSNYFVVYGAALAKQGEQVKSNMELYFGNDWSKFDADKLAKEIGENTVAQLGGEPCESSTYKAVLDPNVVKSLLNAYIDQTDAEEVQKNSSLFVGKLGQKVANKKITVSDNPCAKSIFATSFDGEGVATYNKDIIKNGVLQTYLYNLTTAAKDGVASTGNADRGLGKMGVAPFYLVLKPGKKSQEELFKEVANGVYITDVNGLHAGLNPQSGNFSLQSTGFLIKDGKKDRGLDLVTVSGNLVELFNDVIEIGNDSKTFPSAITCPSVLVKKLVVSGK